MAIRSSVLTKIPNLDHGFGTANEPLPAQFEKYWSSSKPIHQQVHGVKNSEVKKKGQLCGQVDALYTAFSQLPVGVMTADCVPILLSNREGLKVAAVHSGWRGTMGHIVRELWSTLSLEGEIADQWVAAIGPAIGPCCYEVSEELVQRFQHEFLDFGKDTVSPRSRVLDLPSIIEKELKIIGVSTIEVIRVCTFCSTNPVMNSYRKSKSGARQWSVIMKT